MSYPSTGEEIQVLYEIALAIGPKADLERTVESAVSTYLQKLNCSAAAVFETRTAPDGTLTYEEVTALPGQSSLTGHTGAVREHLPDTEEDLDSTLPVAESVDADTHRYVMALPEFGVLVLFKRGTPLGESILPSLRELNAKLATACNRVVVQDQYETQYRELFEEAPVMFALTREVDGEPVIEDCNRQFAETLGHDRDQLRNRPLADLYTEESKQTLREHGYDKALAGEFGTAERVLRTREGAGVRTLLRATPRRDRDGTVVGTNALYVDVTELTRRTQQLAVLNRVLRHDLRNGLTSIKGHLDIAMEEADDEVRDLLWRIDERTESLLSTAEVADRVRSAFDETDFARQDLGARVDTLVERVREEFPEASLTVSTESVPARAACSLDYALWELLENACEHAGDAPSVDVSVRRDGDTGVVTVTDDGPGIPEREQRILREGVETQLDHGSGLGLWLVHWVVETSGGELAFDCADGTDVTVRLPVAED
jgi:PAS domain S-box-containing protein